MQNLLWIKASCRVASSPPLYWITQRSRPLPSWAPPPQYEVFRIASIVERELESCTPAIKYFSVEVTCYFYSQTIGQNLSYRPKSPIAIFDSVLSAPYPDQLKSSL